MTSQTIDTNAEKGQGLIVCGTYEKLLYGLNIVKSGQEGQSVEETGNESNGPIQVKNSLRESFIYPTHLSSISCVSIGTSKYLATGSNDENIKLYDLKLRKEIGNLMIHTGTITCLAFIGKSHLISASQDGTIGITRSSDWELLKKLKGHNGSVLDFNVHSSGKVLLSVGQDSTLKCWDLSRGLLSYSMKLAIMPTMVRWSTCGSRYLVFSDNQISIYSIENENGPIIAKIKSRARINCGVCVKVKWQGEKEDVDVVVYGGEDKILRIACVKTGRILLNLATRHTLRIKDAAALYRPSASSSIVSTCSSEGLVLVWDLEKVLDLQPDASELQEDATIIHSIEESAHTIVAEYDCKCRVTCLAIGTGDTGDEKKRILERGRVEEAARLAKLNEMPESDWEQDEKLKSELAARKKVSVVVDDDDSIHLATSTRVSKNPTATTASVTIISREKNPKVAKKMKKKKAKLQRE